MKLCSILVASILTGVVAFSLICCFYFFGIQSFVFLLFFNFLFISFTLGISGMLKRRIGLLVLGNTAGFFWAYLLSLVSDFGNSYFGESFDLFFRIIFPILNSLWLVSLWSWCMSALQKPMGRRAREYT